MAKNMGEVIRRLRKERDLTQEELAEQIGVTSQAVSKWENNTGLPDISQVVPLANFFGVSTDTLFDFCADDKAREIGEFKSRSQALRNGGKVSEAIALWREALGKYPGNHECMMQLANALFSEANTPESGWEQNAKESIALCERILDGCTDSHIRGSAIVLLSYWYSSFWLPIADEEKAVAFAKMGGKIWSSAEILLESAYFSEEGKKEAERVIDENALSFLDHICLNIAMKDVSDPENELRNCRAALTLWSTLIPDGNYLFFHCRIADLYLKIASCHARLKRRDETLEALRLAKYHAQKKDADPKEKRNYTSPFVSSAVFDPTRSSKNYTESEYELFLDRLKGNCYDFLRDDPGFIALYE